MGSCKTLLLSILKQLSDDQFEEFKFSLEVNGIALSELQKASKMVTINLMVGHFTDNAALKAKEILEEINRKDLAKRLTQLLDEMEGNPSVPSGTAAGGAGRSGGKADSVSVPDVHFVDRHREALIQRVHNVSPILDRLLQKKVIYQETYDDVAALRTKQDQMRSLYSGPLTSAGVRGKDFFYEALRELEPFLVEDLENQV